ncbi:glycosyltransferase [Acinetobacter baumannii]|nr:glycosyltransferase [Acinetobacter baumannii]
MLVSVVLPAYNAELYLKEAIDSVLSQTFTDFELIILNDGSIDRTEEIILSYNDSRIVYVKNEKNLGLIGTLNKGINLAKGKYIARMDADDICLPERFKKQVDFLEKNNEIDLIGTNAIKINNNGDRIGVINMPASDHDIKMMLFIQSPFIHPSIMGRTTVFRSFEYEKEFYRVEDYMLWIRMSQNSKFHNINEFLLKYRYLDNSESKLLNKNYSKKRDALINIYRILFLNNNISFSEDELKTYSSSMVRYCAKDIDFEKLSKIYFRIISKLNNREIKNNLGYRWIISFLFNPKKILQYINLFLCNKLTYKGGVLLYKELIKR